MPPAKTTKILIEGCGTSRMTPIALLLVPVGCVARGINDRPDVDDPSSLPPTEHEKPKDQGHYKLDDGNHESALD